MIEPRLTKLNSRRQKRLLGSCRGRSVVDFRDAIIVLVASRIARTVPVWQPSVTSISTDGYGGERVGKAAESVRLWDSGILFRYVCVSADSLPKAA